MPGYAPGYAPGRAPGYAAGYAPGLVCNVAEPGLGLLEKVLRGRTLGEKVRVDGAAKDIQLIFLGGR